VREKLLRSRAAFSPGISGRGQLSAEEERELWRDIAEEIDREVRGSQEVVLVAPNVFLFRGCTDAEMVQAFRENGYERDPETGTFHKISFFTGVSP
jgi:hypothetical protein